MLNQKGAGWLAKRMSDLHERFGMVSFPGKRQAFIEKYGLAG